MFGIGALAFASPWMLAPLLGLPLLWWLLRVTPPPPRRIAFPAVRLLAELQTEEKTPSRTPWWLLALRFLIAILVLLALAHPLLNPGVRLGTSAAPLLIVIDDGWASAPDWPLRQTTIDGLLVEAERQGRAVSLLTTAKSPDRAVGLIATLVPAAEARAKVRALKPKPWPVDRAAAMALIKSLEIDRPGKIFWISDGLETPDVSAAEFAEALQRLAPIDVVSANPGMTARTLSPSDSTPDRLDVIARRADATVKASATVIGRTIEGNILIRQELTFEAGSDLARASLDLPTEMRNRLARLEIAGEASAAAVVLMDERWRRRPVGLVSGAAIEEQQPLLSGLYFLERALSPTAEIRRGKIAKLLARPLAVMMLADVGRIVGEDKARLNRWIEGGGVLVRFAGPRLAQSADDLVPVRLRLGGRNLGGALTWSTPAALQPFDEKSPFFGLTVPGDVKVRRQVLAEPTLKLADRTWARLTDGTPIVTAEKRSRGWLVLVHTTANTEWSDLPLSGLFVNMLRRIVELAHGVVPGSDGAGGSGLKLAPQQVLDGFGRLGKPTATTASLSLDATEEATPRAGLPPGYYGSATAQRALNLGPAVGQLTALGALPQGVRRLDFKSGSEIDLKPALLTAAILLAILDLAISLVLRGLLALPPRGLRTWRRMGGRMGALVIIAGGLAAGFGVEPRAQATDDEFAMAASLDTRLAYVITGQSDVDEMSRAGLFGLSRMLRRRTSIENAAPMGIDLEIDDIVFFPLIYWPVTPDFPDLSAAAIAKVDAFMKGGGTILFDTRDHQVALIGALSGSITPEARRLRQILAKLDVPPLTPVPPKHILTRAFYLMQRFPGRWSGGRVWVERHSGGINDGVSGIVIGANDWAAAWAIDRDGQPMAAVVPGGSRQREMAFRFGINLVMYTLTGNYKADQVHVPALLERLGQ
jgi:hypothetical protein